MMIKTRANARAFLVLSGIKKKRQAERLPQKTDYVHPPPCISVCDTSCTNMPITKENTATKKPEFLFGDSPKQITERIMRMSKKHRIYPAFKSPWSDLLRPSTNKKSALSRKNPQRNASVPITETPVKLCTTLSLCSAMARRTTSNAVNKLIIFPIFLRLISSTSIYV